MLNLKRIAFFILPIILGMLSVHTTNASTKELSNVQQQINQQKVQISVQKAQQVALQKQLQSQDKSISRSISHLKTTKQALIKIAIYIKNINQEIIQLNTQISQIQIELTRLLDAAYRAGLGPPTVTKLPTSQVKDQRLLKYYHQFNRARLELLNKIKQSKAELIQKRQFLELQQNEQKNTLLVQSKSQAQLKKVRNQRKTTLTSLNSSIDKAQNRLDVLTHNQEQLKQQIIEAEQAAKLRKQQELIAYRKKVAEEQQAKQSYKPTVQERIPVTANNGLGRARHQYSYPVKGAIIHRFGSKQIGQLRWKGIVIKSKLGSSVKAITSGRVILANWLQGYGLLVVIDHGRGYMSLYGYNQNITVRNHQYVKAGQQIAEVGNAGSQQGQASLYFEIRRRGKAVNPTAWLK